MYRRFADPFVLNLIIVQYELISVQNMGLIHILTSSCLLASMAQIGIYQVKCCFRILHPG